MNLRQMLTLSFQLTAQDVTRLRLPLRRERQGRRGRRSLFRRLVILGTDDLGIGIANGDKQNYIRGYPCHPWQRKGLSPSPLSGLHQPGWCGSTIVPCQQYKHLIQHELIACDISGGVKGIFESRFSAVLIVVTICGLRRYRHTKSRLRASGGRRKMFTLSASVTSAPAGDMSDRVILIWS